jgi:hypothetical protein
MRKNLRVWCWAEGKEKWVVKRRERRVREMPVGRGC